MERVVTIALHGPHRSAAHYPRRDRTSREAYPGLAPLPRCQSPIGDDPRHRTITASAIAAAVPDVMLYQSGRQIRL